MNQRQSISGPNLPSHPQPFPVATRIGNLVFSSCIGGVDVENGNYPSGKSSQIAKAFDNMKSVISAAGGSLENIAKVTVYLADKADRELINDHWLIAFPEEESRPVRHTLEIPMPKGRYIQLEFMGVLL